MYALCTMTLIRCIVVKHYFCEIYHNTLRWSLADRGEQKSEKSTFSRKRIFILVHHKQESGIFFRKFLKIRLRYLLVADLHPVAITLRKLSGFPVYIAHRQREGERASNLGNIYTLYYLSFNNRSGSL